MIFNSKHKVILSSQFILLLIAIFSIRPSVLNNYISTYPLIFWVILSGTIILNIYTVLNNYYNKNIVLISVLFLSLVSLTVLLFPIVNKYYLYGGGGDVITHLFMIDQIVDNGYISENNYYPGSHIQVVVTCLITNCDVNWVIMAMPIYLSLIFPVFMIFLSRRIFLKDSITVFVAIMSHVLIMGAYHSIFYPNGIALLLLPIILGVIIKQSNKIKNPSMTIISIIFLIVLPIFHLLVGLYLLSIIITIIVYQKIRRVELVSPHSFSILFVGFVTWFTTFAFWNYNIKALYNWIIGESVTITADGVSGKLANTNLSNIDMLIYIISNYFNVIALIIMSLFLFIYMIKNKNKINYFNFYFIVITMIVTLVWIFVPSSVDISRPIRFWSISLIIASGLSVYYLVIHAENRNNRFKKFISISLAIIITSLLVHGMLVVQPSELIKSANFDVDRQDFLGVSFYIDNVDKDTELVSLSQRYRFFEVALGVNHESISWPFGWKKDVYANPHFSNITNSNLIITNDDISSLKNIGLNSNYNFNDICAINSDDNTVKYYTTNNNNLYYVE